MARSCCCIANVHGEQLTNDRGHRSRCRPRFKKSGKRRRRLRCTTLFVLPIVLVLEEIQYSNRAHWSASHREPPRSTIGSAAVQTAIEYEYRCTEYRPPRRTEYRFAEYEYDEIPCDAGTKRSPKTRSCVTSIRDAVCPKPPVGSSDRKHRVIS